ASIAPFEVSEDKFDCFSTWCSRYRGRFKRDDRSCNSPPETGLGNKESQKLLNIERKPEEMLCKDLVKKLAEIFTPSMTTVG
ncbi:hypothetical protein Ciccas_012388, partial [Cichlidogyrus casuarinus]